MVGPNNTTIRDSLICNILFSGLLYDISPLYNTWPLSFNIWAVALLSWFGRLQPLGLRILPLIDNMILMCFLFFDRLCHYLVSSSAPILASIIMGAIYLQSSYQQQHQQRNQHLLLFSGVLVQVNLWLVQVNLWYSGTEDSSVPVSGRRMEDSSVPMLFLSDSFPFDLVCHKMLCNYCDLFACMYPGAQQWAPPPSPVLFLLYLLLYPWNIQLVWTIFSSLASELTRLNRAQSLRMVHAIILKVIIRSIKILCFCGSPVVDLTLSELSCFFIP